jgi:uncharacterized protein YfkK (UPF0435 family)
MSAMYSEGVADLIDQRWNTYSYDVEDVVAMVARITRFNPSEAAATDAELDKVRAVMADCE